MAALALTINGTTEHLPETPENRESAMRRYWEARQQGDQTAHLARVEDLAPKTTPAPPQDDGDDDPPPAAPAAALPPPPERTRAGTVSFLARERIQLQEEWLAEAGFAMAPPLYAPGTRVLALGDQNFKIERTRVEALPHFGDAAQRVGVEICREERADLAANVHELSLTDAGTLVVGGQEHALEVGAFYQLANLCGFGMGARYLAERCDAPLRAHNVNAQIKQSRERRLCLRTRSQGGLRHVFAVVTPAYAPVDTDAVLSRATPTLQDAHVEMVYDGSGVRATAIWMPDQVVDLAAGDVFKVGVRVETDDTGRGRVRVSAVAFRNRCLNLLVIGEGTVETVSAVHKGDPRAILSKVEQGIQCARLNVGIFLDAWGHARTVKVEPEQILRRWVEHKKLGPIPEKSRDAIVEALLSAWHQEPGDTLADCVNAVSRAAHEAPSWPIDFGAELERRAASLVLARR